METLMPPNFLFCFIFEDSPLKFCFKSLHHHGEGCCFVSVPLFVKPERGKNCHMHQSHLSFRTYEEENIFLFVGLKKNN